MVLLLRGSNLPTLTAHIVRVSQLARAIDGSRAALPNTASINGCQGAVFLFVLLFWLCFCVSAFNFPGVTNSQDCANSDGRE